MASRRKTKNIETDELIDELVDRLMDHPKTQNILEQASTYFDDFGTLIDRAARRTIIQAANREAAMSKREADIQKRLNALYARAKELRERAERINSAARSPVSKEAEARKILGFGEREALTKEKIKQRQREFAKILHPDKGGNNEGMQRVNAAAADLLKNLGV